MTAHLLALVNKLFYLCQSGLLVLVYCLKHSLSQSKGTHCTQSAYVHKLTVEHTHTQMLQKCSFCHHVHIFPLTHWSLITGLMAILCPPALDTQTPPPPTHTHLLSLHYSLQQCTEFSFNNCLQSKMPSKRTQPVQVINQAPTQHT